MPKVSSKDILEKESQWRETSVLWVGSCLHWKGVGKSADTRSHPLFFSRLFLTHLKLIPCAQSWRQTPVVLCSLCFCSDCAACCECGQIHRTCTSSGLSVVDSNRSYVTCWPPLLPPCFPSLLVQTYPQGSQVITSTRH